MLATVATSMMKGFDVRELASLFAKPLPRPMDVPNLLDPADEAQYGIYGLTVAPLLKAAGAKVLWNGVLCRMVYGQRQSWKLFIVRYPSHRHFLAMISNPYYFRINKFREKGVERFEASFTTPSIPHDNLSRHKTMVGVHFNRDGHSSQLDAVREVFKDSAGELAYANKETSPMTFLTRPRKIDPNPLTYKELAMISFPDAVTADEELEGGLIDRLKDALGEDFACHRYTRKSLRSMLKL